ncbi:DNA-directed RNA polymerase subunit delta [Oceanobacillus massiliensis]|uniref:DNA-directed RNA polymerase subunit delta n=1 Tax=Oceanobacillus massiliensis TaxID=1465765 RepID=UPI000289CD4B|nr:DNA-directed RNA polymerase subunit delta [Oceanobacillus massiliensis]
MSLDNFSHEELKNMAMIELASHILFDEKKAINYKEIYDKISEIKGFTAKEKKENISQFYTDMNVDGRFITLGSGMWGLKRWYPVEQAEEEIHAEPKKKKKAKKKKAVVPDDEEVEELDIVDDDIDDVVDGFDDLDDDDDEDFDDDFDDDDDDLDKDMEEKIDEDIDKDIAEDVEDNK